MTQDITPKEEPSDRVERIVELQSKLNDAMLELPQDASVARGLAAFLGVYIDETGKIEPPQDPLNFEFFKAVLALEARVIGLERRARADDGR